MNVITLILIVFLLDQKLKFYHLFMSFYSELIKFYRLITRKEITKEKKAIVFDNASEMYNKKK